MSDTGSVNVAAQNRAPVTWSWMGLYFYLISTLAKTNGHQIGIFIIIDHDNDNTVKSGSDRLVESQQDKWRGQKAEIHWCFSRLQKLIDNAAQSGLALNLQTFAGPIVGPDRLPLHHSYSIKTQLPSIFDMNNFQKVKKKRERENSYELCRKLAVQRWCPEITECTQPDRLH